MHVCKEYLNGVGHIEERDGRFLVSFYGRHVSQTWAYSLQSARFILRRMAQENP